MQRSHILPAAVALAVHVFLLFGFTSPVRPTSFPPEDPPPLVLEPIPQPPIEEPPVFDLPAGGSAPRESTPLPGLPEPAPMKRVDDIAIVAPATRPVAPGPNLDRIPTEFGPSGAGDGSDFSPGGDIITIDGLDYTPRARFQPAPVYPFEQKRLGLSGVVTVSFTVDTTGQVRHAHVVQAEPAGFEDAALRAVSRWRFEPGRKNGRTVPFRMTVPIHFNIAGGS